MAGMLKTSQTTWMAALIKKSFDQSLPQERNTPGQDTSGHATENWSSLPALSCLVKSPTASQLTLYAGVIGSQRAIVVEAMSTDDVKQGDRVTYDSHKWLIHERLNTASYSLTNDYLAVTVV